MEAALWLAWRSSAASGKGWRACQRKPCRRQKSSRGFISSRWENLELQTHGQKLPLVQNILWTKRPGNNVLLLSLIFDRCLAYGTVLVPVPAWVQFCLRTFWKPVNTVHLPLRSSKTHSIPVILPNKAPHPSPTAVPQCRRFHCKKNC